MVQSTLDSFTPTVTATPNAAPTATPTLTSTPSPIPTSIPQSVQLTGVRHEYQKWNNCGPANLSMALSFWGWDGDQRPVAAYVKPNPRDKNVMPYEMANFVEEGTGLKVITRVGGDIELLKKFIAAGFPVLVEKGFEGPGFNGWMGHYEVLTGYDEKKQLFTAQDSYVMADLPIGYDKLELYWRHFNYTYIVIYPPDREPEVFALLGPHVDETYNFQYAAQLASEEIFQLSGRALFFAWFNRGTNLKALQDYVGAAAAFDEAFQIDAELAASDPENRAWRILWYQTGPYFAYYYTGRYYDVVSLADFTINNMSEPAVEESFYWRALAREALGDVAGAIEDFERALRWHPDWDLALAQLRRLGAIS
ncbi:MAG: C39 family peptidase, partial [Anaerolineales bacterium]|nr:C39 family peptidase [Anaerolineales bacterium]